MWDVLSWLFIFLFIGALIGIGALVVRSYVTTGTPTGALFGPRPERRLEVIEQSSVDGRRRLMLIRRDDVEHLIMTGGPVDVVIETGIDRGRTRPAPKDVADEPATPVFSRQPRTLGHAVNE